MHSAPHELIQNINRMSESTEMIAVSDGSMQHQTISYGWVIGTDSGDKWAQHQGLGSGQATSFRAEASGMLSASLFVHHLYKFTHPNYPQQNPPSITFFSDNSGLVNRVNQRLSYAIPFPNSTLASDWDIVEQITQIVSALPHKEIKIQ